MSLKNSTKIRIKKYILEKLELHDASLAKKVADNFGVSLTTVYRYIHELEDEGLIVKENNKYKLLETQEIKTYHTNQTLEEDKIFKEMMESVVAKHPDNVRKIWQYAFTEMMNNAIDHANAKMITVYIAYNSASTKVIIDDDGVGIFSKIKEYYGYDSLDDAVSELFKGKLTTDSENHTGEGIFFTSRVIENFGVLSGGKIFTHNPHFDVTRDIEDVPELCELKDSKGTKVVMIMPNNSRANIKEVFDMFSDVDKGFMKTEIPLKSIFTDGFPVSRSQAKRLSARFDDFEEVILDFDKIDDIGQGFAHELFVVFERNHPEVNIIVKNENDDVKRMIGHVKAR
ncbi:STAS-like domain-containing protein [[Clostridium] scindens]|uniref:STAS-like domain-containing protein n=1 Tax=Clostridium scindens (strain JCM 10418 / VPI 12708) TaxID=29347 RepID=UPI00242BB2A9|nr:DUF4325 domain-containing protein [[Clostridium] scindens]